MDTTATYMGCYGEVHRVRKSEKGKKMRNERKAKGGQTHTETERESERGRYKDFEKKRKEKMTTTWLRGERR